MKKYDSYKDSGIEWIGEIPEHWEVKSFRFCIDVLTDYTANGSFASLAENVTYYDAGYSRLVRLTDLRVNLINEGLYVDENAHNFLKKSELFGGEILIANVGAYAGLVMQMPKIEGKYTLGPNMFLLKVNQNVNFFINQLNAQFCSEQLKLMAISSAQPKLNKENIRQLKVVTPSLEEQTQIANYLDHKTAQIDTLISKKQQFISLLQEERTAVINQAVTKGLDPKVKMKDSGIEWLGEIPEHWEVKKLKYLLKENKDSLKTGPFGSHIKNSDYIPSGSHKVYTQRNVLDNEYENGCESISEEKFEELKGFTIYEGDVLITTRGSIGRCSVFPKNTPTGILHPCLIRIQVNEKLSLRNWIVNYINNTSLFYNNVKFNSNSTIIDVIYGYTLKEIFFPTPSIIEQKKILEFLEAKINEIDTLISKSQQEIELLKEYKTALISEVVTGKVDVRNTI